MHYRSLVAMSFLCCTILMAQAIPGDLDGDGDVDRNDLTLLQLAIGGVTSGPDDPRDLDKDGRITVLDLRMAQLLCTRAGCAVEAASLSVDIAPSELTVLVGQSANISASVVVSASDSTSRLVSVLQSVPSGLTVTPPITTSFIAGGSFTQLDNQTVRGLQVGTFTVTITASSSGLNTATGTLTVNVVQELDPLVLTIPGTIPSALPVNSNTSVLFSVIATGSSTSTPPATITIEGVGNPLILTVTDDGQNGDLDAGDMTYTGEAFVDSNGLSPGQCLSFRAKSGSVTSDVYQLCATSLPIEPAPSNLDLVFDSNGTPVIQNEIVVIVKPGSAEAQIQSLASSVGATIVGGIPLLRMYQFRLNSTPSSLAALQAIVTTIKGNAIVENATTHDVGTTTAVTPNDPRWGTQFGPVKIRADEAWVISRGFATIAVLDTGVDYSHLDLAGKVILGPDYADGDNNPFDDQGHGTHVAGIAAARSNNGIGVTGIAWNSNILAVKVLKAAGGVGAGVALSVAQGIIYSANRGVRVMNLSLGWPTFAWQLITCPAVTYARTVRGTVVVAAAGNNANSTPLYPGGCAGAFTVGSTTSGDGRSTFSNFGGYVSIAAPGTGIMSTVPTGACGLCNATGYSSLNGTSMAAPHVAGAVAVLLARQPGLNASQIEDRLKKTAEPLPAALQLGAGRLDLFEAVFNGSFEESSMALWTRVGTVSSIPQLGGLTPRHRKRMAFLSSGPAGDQVAATMTQSFQIQPGVTSFVLSFDYTFVTEEYPEFVGTQFNDAMTITLVTPSGGTVTLANETVNGSAFSAIGGINFPGGDNTTGWTGWKTVTRTIPVTAGPGTYRVFITDAGDDIYDSALLLDKIRLK